MSFIDFLGIGAQKAGTTWLYENLKGHPEIFFPPEKEVHFWDMFYERGVPWYQSLFAGNMDKVCGEITPAYAILPLERIKEIKVLNSRLKIIFIMRNPIERAWSAALMELERAGIKYEEAPDEWFIREFTSEASLKRGDYEACLRNWLKYFPRRQILLLKYEEIKTKPLALLKKVADHLGVDESFFARSSKINDVVFAGKNYPLRQTLKPKLEELYNKKIVDFEGFLKEIG